MITIEEFKTYYKRDFPFLPVWNSEQSYNKGEIVYYEPTRLFYTCLNNLVTSRPTVSADWEISEDDIYNYVLDTDIEKAIGEMTAMLPIARFEGDVLRIAQMYLTAHCLIHDTRTANGGLASTFPFPMQSRSVGNVSESYGIPARFLQKEVYSFYITSGYGLKYLALLIPRTRGNVAVVKGWTMP